MKLQTLSAWLPGLAAAALLAGCAGGAARGLPIAPAPSLGDTAQLAHVDSLGHAVARTDREAAADQAALEVSHVMASDCARGSGLARGCGGRAPRKYGGLAVGAVVSRRV